MSGSVSQSRVHSRRAVQHFLRKEDGPHDGWAEERRSLRIAVLVAAAGPAMALVTACSATGGAAGAGASARAHPITGGFLASTGLDLTPFSNPHH